MGRDGDDLDIKWWLVRGRNDPRVWPFRSRDEGLAFQEDHDLRDWRLERVVNDEEDEHKPYCGRCHEPWTCTHTRLNQQAQRILYTAKHTCARCGKQAAGTITVPGGGELGEDVVYHSRKGACRNMAKRELERLGHTDLLEKVIRDEAEAERRNLWYRAYRAAKKEGKSMDEAVAIAHETARSEARA